MQPRFSPFFLQLGQISASAVMSLTPSFNNLPSSAYKDGAYRLRRFSHFNFANNSLIQLPTKAFSQSSHINHFQGDVARNYEDIEEHIISAVGFLEMFQTFKEMANLPEEQTIEVHQIRINAEGGKSIPVAPEGIHQDGCARIAIFVIQRHNIRGGRINVHIDDHHEPFLSHKFDRGEFIVLNDRRFFHSATEVETIHGTHGHLDVFVLTAK